MACDHDVLGGAWRAASLGQCGVVSCSTACCRGPVCTLAGLMLRSCCDTCRHVRGVTHTKVLRRAFVDLSSSFGTAAAAVPSHNGVPAAHERVPQSHQRLRQGVRRPHHWGTLKPLILLFPFVVV
jgi:hypothetical protein